MHRATTLVNNRDEAFTVRGIAHSIVRGADVVLLVAGIVGFLYVVPVVIDVEVPTLARGLLGTLPVLLTGAVALAVAVRMSRPSGIYIFDSGVSRACVLAPAVLGPLLFISLCGVEGLSKIERDRAEFDSNVSAAEAEVRKTREKLSDFIALNNDVYNTTQNPRAKNEAYVNTSDRVRGVERSLDEVESKIELHIAAFKENPDPGNEAWVYVSTKVYTKCNKLSDEIKGWTVEIKKLNNAVPPPNIVAFDISELDQRTDELLEKVESCRELLVLAEKRMNSDKLIDEIMTALASAKSLVEKKEERQDAAMEAWAESGQTSVEELDVIKSELLPEFDRAIASLAVKREDWRDRIKMLILFTDQQAINRKPWDLAEVYASRTIHEARKLSSKAGLVRRDSLKEQINKAIAEWSEALEGDADEYNTQRELFLQSKRVNREPKRQMESVIPDRLNGRVDSWLKDNDRWRAALDIPHPERRPESRDFGYWLRFILSFGLDAKSRMEVVLKDHEAAFEMGKVPDLKSLEDALSRTDSDAERKAIIDATLANAQSAWSGGRITEEQYDEVVERINSLLPQIEAKLSDVQRDLLKLVRQGAPKTDVQSLLKGRVEGVEGMVFLNVAERLQYELAFEFVDAEQKQKYWFDFLSGLPIQNE